MDLIYGMGLQATVPIKMLLQKRVSKKDPRCPYFSSKLGYLHAT